ncbi:MAG: hypothetical protein AAFY30_12580, partial [Cyanobacteria bacterium J06642_12]
VTGELDPSFIKIRMQRRDWRTENLEGSFRKGFLALQDWLIEPHKGLQHKDLQRRDSQHRDSQRRDSQRRGSQHKGLRRRG